MLLKATALNSIDAPAIPIRTGLNSGTAPQHTSAGARETGLPATYLGNFAFPAYSFCETSPTRGRYRIGLHFFPEILLSLLTAFDGGLVIARSGMLTKKQRFRS